MQWHEVGIGKERRVNIIGYFAKDMYGSQIGGKAIAWEGGGEYSGLFGVVIRTFLHLARVLKVNS